MQERALGDDGLANSKMRDEMFSSQQHVRPPSELDGRLGQDSDGSDSDEAFVFSPQDGGPEYERASQASLDLRAKQVHQVDLMLRDIQSVKYLDRAYKTMAQFNPHKPSDRIELHSNKYFKNFS